MIKIKKLRMKNFCGFRDNEIDFVNKNGEVNDISLFFGPNGEGKSTILNAIQIVSSPKEYVGRDLSISFRKFIYHEDYDPGYHELKLREGLIEQEDMEVEGIFETEEGEKRVVFSASTSGKKSGIVLNELSSQRRRYNNNTNSYFIDADNPTNMHRFVLPNKYMDKFLDIAETVYGFECALLDNSKTELPIELLEEEDGTFFDDFTIKKVRNGEEVRVHYKRMSAGEKKIATLLRHLCNPDYIDSLDMILVDNLEMHVYFKRHRAMIDKLLEHFPNKQFICTSHSETMIDHVGKIRGKESLFDLEGIHETVKKTEEDNQMSDWVKV